MNKFILALIGLTVVLLAGLFVWMRPAAPPHLPAAVLQSVDPGPPLIRIEQGKRVSGPEVIRVQQGERVEIRFISEQAAELHLHGYDRYLELPAGDETRLILQAEHSGRFEYELHGHDAGGHQALGVIEVLPR